MKRNPPNENRKLVGNSIPVNKRNQILISQIRNFFSLNSVRLWKDFLKSLRGFIGAYSDITPMYNKVIVIILNNLQRRLGAHVIIFESSKRRHNVSPMHALRRVAGEPPLKLGGPPPPSMILSPQPLTKVCSWIDSRGIVGEEEGRMLKVKLLRLGGRGASPALRPALSDLRRNASNSWSAVQDVYLSIKVCSPCCLLFSIMDLSILREFSSSS